MTAVETAASLFATLDAAGAVVAPGASFRDGPLQRCFRDLHAGAQHFFASDAASIDWARGLLARH